MAAEFPAKAKKAEDALFVRLPNTNLVRHEHLDPTIFDGTTTQELMMPVYKQEYNT